jgi:hypothetical protein
MGIQENSMKMTKHIQLGATMATPVIGAIAIIGENLKLP